MAVVTGRVTPIVALDVAGAAEALAITSELAGLCDFYKIGSELFTASGPDVVKAVLATGARVFLDLKLHDIPNTVRGASRSAAALGASLLTVHAAGGPAMVSAAVAGAREGSRDCRVLGVTVLTSLDGESLGSVWARQIADVEAEVLRLARLVRDAGAAGVVCSGREAAAVRAGFGAGFETLVPGVRLPGGSTQDQARVVTPAEAAAAGATYVVLGRAVTQAESPRRAMEAVLAALP